VGKKGTKQRGLTREGAISKFGPLLVAPLTRFDRWDEILAEKDDNPDYMPFTKSFRHATRVRISL